MKSTLSGVDFLFSDLLLVELCSALSQLDSRLGKMGVWRCIFASEKNDKMLQRFETHSGLWFNLIHLFIMAIKYVKVKRTINVGDNPGEKFLARIYRGQDVEIDQIASEISEATTVTHPDVLACLKALEFHIVKYISAGQAVKLGLLGSFIPSISAKAMATPDEVTADSIKRARCRFYPSVQFKNSLTKCQFKLADLNVQSLVQE